jgi:membrane protein
MALRKAWNIAKTSFSEFIDNKVLKLSAALAYYTIFSLPGLLLIIIWVSDIFYGRQAIDRSIYGQISEFVGPDAGLQVQETIRAAAMSNSGGWAAVIGIATLLFGATGVFSEIQDSINQIWHLKAKPKKGRGLVTMILNRLLSFSMIITLGFLLLVSLILNGLMDVLFKRLEESFPTVQVFVVYGVNTLITFLITSLLFGIIFKVLPDAKIKWKDVKAGAMTTAVLFMLGRFLISFYIGQDNRLATAYGAAGSVIIILLWVYYAATILYFGAVFTRVYAISRGCKIFPSKYAVWVEQKEIESTSSLKKHAEVTGVTKKIEEE